VVSAAGEKNLREQVLGSLLIRSLFAVEIVEDLDGAGEPEMRVDVVVLVCGERLRDACEVPTVELGAFVVH